MECRVNYKLDHSLKLKLVFKYFVIFNDKLINNLIFFQRLNLLFRKNFNSKYF